MSLEEKFFNQMLEIDAKINALKEFPDLEEFTDRWGIVRLISKKVNNTAEKFEVHNECDCCDKIPVYAMPYIEYQGIRIYSNPCLIKIATKNKGKIYSNGYWEDEMYDKKFAGVVIGKIYKWFDIMDDEEEEIYNGFDPYPVP